ncbi:class I SAM-dependent methyltransferase [Mycetohabitans sp. B8]|uniref:class I SAM-dependent methyltransferase n=1 Tax=Mycetohabitans sp. B8 TaxID=2841845 RepID=UPI001F39CCF5|nr:class I SAM-dependent methyltransferase [Mycetohabitans sp. B8]MCG1041289.1 class I SAM-dependent methyltransferase [Mycetohabitans sp. B8]
MKPNSTQPDSLPVPGDTELAHVRTLVQHIAGQIAAAGGWLPFDRYMELALYTPGLGYYSGGLVKFGRGPDDGSDFITAPELSPLFAQTFAKPVAELLGATGTRHVVEFGAGTGKFAAGLLRTLDALGVGCARYTIVELSGELRARQRECIAETAPQFASCVQWVDTLPERVEGVIVGNEVLDAMPVRLFARQDGLWHERGVAVADASRFVFADRPLAAAAVPAALACVPGRHDYVTETHEAAAAFVRTVCSVLDRGAALFVDYGFPAAEYYHPQRTEGTLMCHYRHRAHGDPFLYPGLQDITAHVQFSAIGQAAHDAGAHWLGYTSQARFLMNAGITDSLAQLDPADPARFLPAANAVQKLLSEAEMGELFKVIAFCRGLDAAPGAFERGDRSHML